MMFDVDDWVLTYSKNNRDYSDRRKIQEYIGRITSILSRGQYTVDTLMETYHGPVLLSQLYFDYELSIIEPTEYQILRWSLAKMKQ